MNAIASRCIKRNEDTPIYRKPTNSHAELTENNDDVVIIRNVFVALLPIKILRSRVCIDGEPRGLFMSNRFTLSHP